MVSRNVLPKRVQLGNETPWGDDEIAHLKELARGRMSVAVVAYLMKRSYKAVAAKSEEFGVAISRPQRRKQLLERQAKAQLAPINKKDPAVGPGRGHTLTNLVTF